MELPNGRYYIPDLVYLSRAHLNLMAEDGKIYGAPDLVIEILSQNRARDAVKKFTAYQEVGVPWYWIIDPIALTVEEYRLTPDGYLRASTVDNGEDFRPHLFEGLVINLEQLLKDLREGEAPAEPVEGENSHAT
ncbi:Uma2 family endonuclease [Candidatus Poribacteria bacterium]|nr:Uma2 family endonuclease [Candidatus Poribacteria bacterium]